MTAATFASGSAITKLAFPSSLASKACTVNMRLNPRPGGPDWPRDHVVAAKPGCLCGLLVAHALAGLPERERRGREDDVDRDQGRGDRSAVEQGLRGQALGR